MKLVFIGTGSAFTVGGNYQSNMYFENDSKKRFLIDCGSDARHALHDLGLTHKDINAVYISHLHADHVGGLEWLAFKTYFDPNYPGKIQLYIAEGLIDQLWNTLSGGLHSLEEFVANITTYFDVHPIKEDGRFTWENTEFEIFRTDHVMSNYEQIDSFGIMGDVGKKKVLLSTDTCIPKSKQDHLYKNYLVADIIFQDCETALVKSTVHAHYTELVKLPPEIKKKMWLYHYQAGPLPDAKAEGFLGFVKKGQSFDL